MEFFEDKFRLILDGFSDIPDKVITLRQRADDNDEEHRDFRAKINVLEKMV